jgi:hypothetical protein
LGVLGRNGWFCAEADVERWNALAGWRGLKDLAVRQHFSNTFLAFESEGFGPNEALLANLGLGYEIAVLGAGTAGDVIQSRLDAGVPALFYLWSPHPLNARYSLNRIQLPAYTPALFDRARSDYPTDVLEKLASKQLTQLVPDVADAYAHFQIDNWAQESMLAAVDSDGMSVMQATCAWMRTDGNVATLRTFMSCDCSMAWVDGNVETVEPSSQIRVHLRAYGIDSLPIPQTSVDVEFRFGGQVLSLKWLREEDTYTADVPADQTHTEGAFELALKAVYGWSNASKGLVSCDLLRRTILVRAAPSISTWVPLGGVGLAVLLVIVLLVYLRRHKDRLDSILALVAAEATELVGALCMELSHMVTSGYVCYRVFHGETPVPRQMYKSFYLGLTCLKALALVCCVGYRLRNARLVRQYVREHGQQGSRPETAAQAEGPRASMSRNLLQRSASSSKMAAANKRAMEQLEFESAQCRRTMVLASLTLMTAALEGAGTQIKLKW